MDGVNRRSFFKIVGALSAAAGVPSIVGLAEPTPQGSRVLGYIRETFAYDLYRDDVVVRFDVLAGDVQVTYDMRYASEEECNAHLPEAREIAGAQMEKLLRKYGKSWADLRSLPPLDAYPRPPWVMA